jgi:branched-chain amino acid transport system ATP-binding protein
MALLALDALTSGYGRNRVIQGVSLDVRAREIVALIGANGAGKSTLLNTIMGLVPASGGSILFNGGEIAGWATPRIVRGGLVQVPERRQLFGTMTVEENLRMGTYLMRSRARSAGDLDAQFARFPILRERRNQLAQTLSGGEQQMLAIARAIISRPTMLLLDEPSLGLAPLAAEQVMRLIAGLRDEGTTILLVEQNARAALGLADRGYVLETGRIAFSGAAADLLGNPAVAEAYLGGSGGEEGMEQRIRRKKTARVASVAAV